MSDVDDDAPLRGPSISNLKSASGDVVQDLVFRPVPADMWGVTILICVGDLPRIFTCCATLENVVRCTFGVIAFGVNVWLQLAILYFVSQYIVGQSIHDSQKNYAQYHREVFNNDGSFNDDKWKAWTGPYMDLCNLAMAKVGFTLTIIFIWTTRMLGEFRSIVRLHRDLHKIAALPADGAVSDMLYAVPNENGEVDWESQWRLIALSCGARASIYLLVVFPKLAINIILLKLGIAWLASTESFADLILNALALSFVIDVDELIYVNFAPARLQEWIDRVSIMHVKGAGDGDLREANSLRPYLESLAYLTVCGAWSYLYLVKLQQVIPAYEFDISEHCTGWFTRKYEALCEAGGDSVPTGDCFPYGKEWCGADCPVG